MRKVVVDEADVGLVNTCGRVDVDDAAGRERVGDNLADRGLQLHVVGHAWRRVAAGPAQLHGDGLEERQVVAEPQRLRRRDGQRERLPGHSYVLQETVWQVHLSRTQQMLEGSHDGLDLGSVRTRVERLSPRAPVEQLP